MRALLRANLDRQGTWLSATGVVNGRVPGSAEASMAEVSEPSLLLTLRWRGVDSNHRFRESRHRCPHVDFSVEAAELWGAPAVWSVTSSSIKVMTQASSPNASDFFNSLLSGSLAPRAAGAVALAADRLSGSAAVPSNGRYRKGFGCRPSERSTRVYDTCRDGNGHIRLFAKEVLTRFRRIKPVTVS
jgi:hypothetical protein